MHLFLLLFFYSIPRLFRNKQHKLSLSSISLIIAFTGYSAPRLATGAAACHARSNPKGCENMNAAKEPQRDWGGRLKTWSCCAT